MTDRNAPILQLAEWGYHLVPWHPRSATVSASRPLLTGWLERRLSPQEVNAYARLHPNADWAIVPQETVVLDLEEKRGLHGEADCERLFNDCGLSWADATSQCPSTRTKSGGLHLWFRQPHGEPLVGGCHLRPSIECKSRNGSVHIPPSFGYTEVVRLRPASELPVLPERLCALWRESVTGSRRAHEPLRSTFSNGERRLMLCRVAGRLRASLAMNEPELYASLIGVRDNRCDDPSTFTDQEIRTIARDFARKDCGSAEAYAIAGYQAAENLERLFTRPIPDRPNPAV